jgi:hypothetical protein
MRTSRRQLLQWAGAATVASFVPGCGRGDAAPSSGPPPPPSSAFFSEAERSALVALADVVIPAGPTTPGGAELGAVAYIERLCTAFEGTATPFIFAGGPFSGRRPFPTASGEPGTTSPSNDFATFLPLDRATERAWRIELYGSAATDGGTFNDPAIVAPVIGIRNQMKSGLADVIAGSPSPIASLAPQDLHDVFAGLDVDFRDLLIQLVTEATFSAPEYGGNVGLGGWKLARYEGDNLPLGYSVYSEMPLSAGGAPGYREAADAPVSGPYPGADPAAMTDETLEFARAVVGFLGGREIS